MSTTKSSTTQPAAKKGHRIQLERRTHRGQAQCRCRYCHKWYDETPANFYSRQAEHAEEGKLFLSGRCRACEATYRTAKRAELKSGERVVKPRKAASEASETAAPATTPAKATTAKKAPAKKTTAKEQS